MTTKEIAEDLVSLCRQGEFDQAVQKYYSENIHSHESNPHVPDADGINAVLQKSKEWAEHTEVHNVEVSDPIVAGEYFTCTMKMDSTNKQTGQRSHVEEVCVYQVHNDKIIREDFFYGMPNPSE